MLRRDKLTSPPRELVAQGAAGQQANHLLGEFLGIRSSQHLLALSDRQR